MFIISDNAQYQSVNSNFSNFTLPLEVPSKEEIHVWLVDLKLFHFKHKYLEKYLSEEELIKADRFKFSHDRLRFLAAHGYLRAILSLYYKSAPCSIEYRNGVYGKPFLKNQPPSYDLYFNMSHSHEMGAYAITNGIEVGIDIEFINDNVYTGDRNISKMILSEREYAIFKKIEKSLKIKSFFRIWTCKEALLKATGEGLNYPLDKIEVSIFPSQALKILSIDGNKVRASSWAIHSLICPKKYVGTIALNCKKRKPKYFEYDYSPIYLK